MRATKTAFAMLDLSRGPSMKAEAHLMVVTCSALVNFLIVKAEAADLLKTK